MFPTFMPENITVLVTVSAPRKTMLSEAVKGDLVM